jgi:hypothetical protein
MLFDKSARTLDSVVLIEPGALGGAGSVGTHSPNDVLLAKDLKPTLAVGFFSPTRHPIRVRKSIALVYALRNNRGS